MKSVLAGSEPVSTNGNTFFRHRIEGHGFAFIVTDTATAETVKATVRNAASEVAAEQDNIAAPRVFVLQPGRRKTAETWSITFEKASVGVLEDVSVQTVGVPPLFNN